MVPSPESPTGPVWTDSCLDVARDFRRVRLRPVPDTARPDDVTGSLWEVSSANKGKRRLAVPNVAELLIGPVKAGCEFSLPL